MSVEDSVLKQKPNNKKKTKKKATNKRQKGDYRRDNDPLHKYNVTQLKRVMSDVEKKIQKGGIPFQTTASHKVFTINLEYDLYMIAKNVGNMTAFIHKALRYFIATPAFNDYVLEVSDSQGIHDREKRKKAEKKAIQEKLRRIADPKLARAEKRQKEYEVIRKKRDAARMKSERDKLKEYKKTQDVAARLLKEKITNEELKKEMIEKQKKETVIRQRRKHRERKQKYNKTYRDKMKAMTEEERLRREEENFMKMD